ncbi:hypothetical protein QR685DRAFT_528703 [Neurospora intermedia]|uniref:Uncharacterized protein n=1 Tax=Neurospora intermedia TaxID=5142 RepID=A0ABR3D8Q8_NEUIN
MKSWEITKLGGRFWTSGITPDYGKGLKTRFASRQKCVKAGRVLRAGTARFEWGRPGGPMPVAGHSESHRTTTRGPGGFVWSPA